MHDGLSGTLSERHIKLFAVVSTQVVPDERLAAVLVDSLRDLVAGGITKTREERKEFAAGRCAGVLLEDDGIELGEAADLGLVAHEPLRDGVHLFAQKVSLNLDIKLKKIKNKIKKKRKEKEKEKRKEKKKEKKKEKGKEKKRETYGMENSKLRNSSRSCRGTGVSSFSFPRL